MMRAAAPTVVAAALAAGVLAGTTLDLGAQAGLPAPPRTADGHPDFSGVWQAVNTAYVDVEPHHASEAGPAGAGVVLGGPIPYQPWALEQRQKNFANQLTEDTEPKCFLPGVPRITYLPYPFQIVQTPARISVLYEYVHAVRHIYTNGTPHPEGPIEWWMGDSRGHWEDDSLVVDTIHFNGRTRFDRAGNFASDALHVVERYRFIDRDHLDYHVTIEDAKVFTRPWEMRMPLYRRIEAGVRPLEYDSYAFKDVFRLP